MSPYVLDYNRPADLFVFTFPYNQTVVEQIKQVRGRAYDTATKRWTAPSGQHARVEALAIANGFQFTVAAETAIQERQVLAAADGIGVGDYDLIVNTRGDRFVFQGVYDVATLSEIHRIGGRSWDKTARQWTFPLNSADLIEKVLVDGIGVTVSPEALAIMDRWSHDAKSMIAASHAMDADLDIPGFPVDRLFNYQKAGIVYIRDAGYSCFIGDRPRVGKTLQAIGALALAGTYPAVVVAPMGACINWERVFNDFMPDLRVWIAKGTKRRPISGYDIVIVGWQNVAAWKVELIAMKPQALIIDECHRGKAGRAQRSAATLAIGRSIPVGQPRLGLSGTVVENNYKELEHQLKIIGRWEQFGGHAYKKKWASPDAQERLHALLRSTCYVRRNREEATGVIDPERSIFTVEGDPHLMGEYEEARINVLEYLAQKAREKAVELGKDPESAAVMAAMRAGGAAHLVAIGVLRQLAARAKIAAMVEYAQRWLEDTTASLVIFAYHRSVIEGVSNALGCPRIIGGDGAVARQAVIDGFAAGEHRIVVASIPAAGEAISLAAANDEIFLEQAWHPSALRQAEDRAVHVSKPGVAVNVEYWIVDGTIDVDMLDLIEEKRQNVDVVTDGGARAEGWDSSSSIAGDLIERLTKRGLALDGHHGGGDIEQWIKQRSVELDGPDAGQDTMFDLDLDDFGIALPDG